MVETTAGSSSTATSMRYILNSSGGDNLEFVTGIGTSNETYLFLRAPVPGTDADRLLQTVIEYNNKSIEKDGKPLEFEVRSNGKLGEDAMVTMMGIFQKDVGGETKYYCFTITAKGDVDKTIDFFRLWEVNKDFQIAPKKDGAIVKGDVNIPTVGGGIPMKGTIIETFEKNKLSPSWQAQNLQAKKLGYA